MKAVKKFLLIVGLLVLVGQSACGGCHRTVANWTDGWSRLCVDGVSYLQFSSGATVEYNPNGTVKVCK